MIEAMDFHIGRLVEYLKAQGQYNNTIFIFTSDNGGEASGPSDPNAFPARLGPENLGYNLDYDTLGLKGSFSTIGPSFASAAVSPLSYYQFYAGEGGVRVPLIISGKPGIPQQLSPALAWATDITPTILSLAGVAQPKERYAGRPVEVISGRDLTPLLTGKQQRGYGPDDAIGYELTDHGVLFQGDYKLVVNQPPVGDGQWHLYNIVEDPGETKDLASDQPLRFEQMLASYETYRLDNRVISVPQGYNQIKQLVSNSLQGYRDEVVILLLTLLVLLPFFVAYQTKRRSQ